jgi:hypothetical protein
VATVRRAAALQEQHVTFGKFIFIPIFIALLATSMMVLDIFKEPTLRHYQPWISFQAWAMYFLAGCTLKGGGKVMLGYLGGAVASVAIMEFAGVLGGWGLGQAAVPVAVFFVVVPVISAERVPGFNFVPGWFVGAGVYFALIGLFPWPGDLAKWDKYLNAGLYLMVSCAVGMVYGIVTVFIRTRYEAMVEGKGK